MEGNQLNKKRNIFVRGKHRVARFFQKVPPPLPTKDYNEKEEQIYDNPIIIQSEQMKENEQLQQELTSGKQNSINQTGSVPITNQDVQTKIGLSDSKQGKSEDEITHIKPNAYWRPILKSTVHAELISKINQPPVKENIVYTELNFANQPNVHLQPPRENVLEQKQLRSIASNVYQQCDRNPNVTAPKNESLRKNLF